MTKPPNDGGPAFPDALASKDGMSLRDWFATFAPEAPDGWVRMELESDMRANPHGDHYKPKRRSESEIRAAWKYQYADAMLAARNVTP